MSRAAGVLFTLLLLSTPAAAAKRTAVFVLFDGFAPQLIDQAPTPNLDRIRAGGAWTHELEPVFPTVSAVNHNSYVTGCTPSRHGIVSNYFHDPEKGYFDGVRDADWRLACESIWETVERQGGVAAALGFAGHFSTERGATATHAPLERQWPESPEDPVRTDQVLELLALPAEDRPDFIAAYYKGPDWIAHWSGTGASETIAATSSADAEVGRLMAAIEALPEGEEALLFVAADHAMVDVTTYFNIGRIMTRLELPGRYASDGAHAFIYLDDKSAKARIVDALAAYDMLSVFEAGDFPDYYPGDSAGRSGDILIVLDQPYWIADPHEFPDWARWLGLTAIWPEVFDVPGGIKATHGYPPDDAGMGTTFYAWGEGVRPGYEIPQIRMIDAAPSALAWLQVTPDAASEGQPVTGMFQPAATLPATKDADQR